jgi:hypothetical protein
MILSKYNKFLFSVFSESNNFLIISVYALRLGKKFISFLQVQYSKTNPSGKFLPLFVYNTRLKVIDNSDRDIIFSQGRIIFKDDSVKVEFSSELVMIYLNFTWDQNKTSPITELGKEAFGNDAFTWNSFDFRGSVKGNFITALTSLEFNEAAGNIDLIKTKRFPFEVPVHSLLWSRLQDKEVNLAYSFIFNRVRKSDSKLLILHSKKLVEFSDIEYHVIKEKVSQNSSVKYPESIHLTAKNNEYQVSIDVHDHTEINVIQLFNDIDFIGKLFTFLFRSVSGNPKQLSLLAQADVIIYNKLTRTEFNGVMSISDYVSFSKRNTLR